MEEPQEHRRNQISRILWKNFHNRIDYENLASDLWLEEWKRGRLHSYQYIIFRGIDEVRRRNHEVEYVPGVHEGDGEPCWDQDSRESLVSSLMWKASLSLAERWLLYERFTKSLTIEEISREHSLHPTVVSRMIREIIEKLRLASLEKHYDARNGPV